MQTVKESLNEGYCDISGHPTDMTMVGEMGGIKIYVAKGALSPVPRLAVKKVADFNQDVPDARTLMQQKGESLARFIYTIRPLQEVYTLPPTSLHIFYDRAGELIAFNRNASLFLNLRYFEQWRKCSSGFPTVSIADSQPRRRRRSTRRQNDQCLYLLVSWRCIVLLYRMLTLGLLQVLHTSP